MPLPPPPLVIPDTLGLGKSITLPTRSCTQAAAQEAKAHASLIMLANIALATRSSTAITALIAAVILDHDTGQSLEYRQLIKHPKYQEIWSSSYAKELGRLFQGFKGSNSTAPPVNGTNTFHVIDFEDIPTDHLTEVCYSNVVCKVRLEKTDPNRTRITIAGNRICYPGDVGIKTAPLDLVKLMINSVLSHADTKFCMFDIANFYHRTPLEHPEFVRICLDDIPQEFITKYNLAHHVRDGWVYFKIVKGIYNLPHSGILANKLLEKRLNLIRLLPRAETPARINNHGIH
jgi:hypothetical protein